MAAALGMASMFGVLTPASATAPDGQTFSGTLRFCESDCELGTLEASGPIDGTATIEFISDRPNRQFSITHAQLRLTIDGTDTVTIAMMLRSTDGDVSEPCRVSFNEDGRWRIIDGTGRFANLRGEGVIHNDGLAVGHDPQCEGAPYSLVDWHLTGRAHLRSN